MREYTRVIEKRVRWRVEELSKRFYFCAICGFSIDNSRFPEDFPDEFKWCCGCLEWARLIVGKEIIFLNAKLPSTRKILTKITLVGGNGEKERS